MFDVESAFYCDKYESVYKGVCVYIYIPGVRRDFSMKIPSPLCSPAQARRNSSRTCWPPPPVRSTTRPRVLKAENSGVYRLGDQLWKSCTFAAGEVSFSSSVPYCHPSLFPPDESTDRELRHVQLFVISWGHWPRSCLSLTWSIAVLHGEIHSCARKLRRRYNLAGKGAFVSLYTVLAVSLVFLNP